MKKKIQILGVAAGLTALLLGNLTPANAAYQSNGSFGAMYIYAGASVIEGAAWDGIATGSSSNAARSVLQCPASAATYSTFITSAATISDPNSWGAYGGFSNLNVAKTVSSPNVSPDAQINGAPATIKGAGGTYALGLACLSNSNTNVVAAYYRTITVTAVTGAWTAAAVAADTVGASLPTPTWSVTTNSSLPAAVGRAAGTVYVGDVLTANMNQPAVFPGDYTTTYQWKRNGNAIASRTASTYTVVDADGYAKISVDVVYTAGGTSVTKSSIESPMVLGGSAVLGGTVSLSAGVSAIANGFLELSIPTNAAATFGAPAVVNNYSVTTGTLGNVQVNDTRWITTDGWNLQADVATFVSGANSIAKSNFGLVPSVVTAATTATGITAAAGTVAGSATYPAPLASSAKSADLGDTGVSVLNAALTLRAPRTTPAGTYTSTITLTLATK
jgi:hypothetical protein